MTYSNTINLLLVCAFISFATTGCQQSYEPVDLQDRWDSTRVLENPDKGWYQHVLDNGIDKYHIRNDSLFQEFPGMDHLYIRIAWAFLEPKEGEYDWSYIDDIADEYVPRGYGISFSISTKETGDAPHAYPRDVNGVGYATPYWVRQAGAEGTVPDEFGPPVWTPDWDDPVYLEKLSNFHEAFAERYDDKPWVRYIDISSIGEWGEGHTNRSTRIPPTEEEVKANMDIYLKHYEESLLIASDGLIFWNKPDSVVTELYEYAISNGISIRDNSPMVEWHIDTYTDTWSVSHPRFFERVYRERPTVFELQHYSSVKEDGHWLGKNGRDTIPDLGVSGADIFRNAMELIRPTYIGYHGYAEEWYTDNPDLTEELLNLAGYWFFPKRFQRQEADGNRLSFTIDWLNKGVAPAYDAYALRGKLTEKGNDGNTLTFELENSGNRDWMPDSLHSESYSVPLDQPVTGTYQLSVQLYDRQSEQPVQIGVDEEYLDEQDYFSIDDVTF